MHKRMLLDILPIKDDGITSCFDVQLQAVGKWKNVDYELMYIDNWKFAFWEEEFKGKGIWERGKLAPRLYFDDKLKTTNLFEKYHGIKLNSIKQLDVSCLEEILDDSLFVKRNPILLAFDTYYIPWLERFYRKIHSIHMIMVVGKTEKGYLFNDTRPFLLDPVHGEFLEWKVVKEGFANRVTLFEDVKISYDFYDVKKELLSIDFKMFSQMQQVAQYIKENEIAYEDLVDFDGGNGILIRAFRNIIRSRVHYQECLKYIQKKYDLPVDKIVNDFSLIIREWNIVKNLLYKSYLSEKYNEIREIVADKVHICGEMEERAANDLFKYISVV